MHHDELYDKIKMLEQENDELRELVKESYEEGWDDGTRLASGWGTSLAKQELEKLT